MGCVLLYLQREGGLRTRQGRRVEVAGEKDGGHTNHNTVLIIIRSPLRRRRLLYGSRLSLSLFLGNLGGLERVVRGHLAAWHLTAHYPPAKAPRRVGEIV